MSKKPAAVQQIFRSSITTPEHEAHVSRLVADGVQIEWLDDPYTLDLGSSGASDGAKPEPYSERQEAYLDKLGM
ncbi:MAG: hypothetical protein GC137_01545 [Alphaproteobacteria bacterium]|nr:hypothetical protein [Alphaproteobacteria bacterium]